MVLADTPIDATLYEVLRARAMRAAPRQLWLFVALGLGASATGYLARPKGWLILLCAGIASGAFGTWALAERALMSETVEGAKVIVALVVRALAALIGILAAALLPFVLAGLQLASTANT